MIRISLISLIIFGSQAYLFGQQLPRFTQYANNQTLLNPAATGSKKFTQIYLVNRYQWVGFGSNAPNTQLIGGHSSIDKKNYGIGGYVFNDSYGPYRNTGINLSYSYHIKVADKSKFSLGLSGALSMAGIKGSEILVNDAQDIIIDQNSNKRSSFIDAGFGLLLYSENYFIGLSSLHLPQTESKVFQGSSSLSSARHNYLMAGIVYDVNNEISIKPSLYANYIENNPLQLDLNVLLDYQKIVQVGVSYRSQDAISLLFGYRFLDNWEILYSYDLIYTALRRANVGSHELTLSYRYYYNPLYADNAKSRYKLKKVKKSNENDD